MNHLEIALAVRSFVEGRGIRSAKVRHRRLVQKPIALVLWQLGPEPFSVAAAAMRWGDSYSQPQMSIAGEPRNRDSAFASLLKLAKWFNPRFDSYSADRETFIRGNQTISIARSAPQILVANRATVEFIGRLGRRLAYLPTNESHPVDPDLNRLGRHFLFLWDHFSVPGQQLILSMTDLLNTHWMTAQSAVERQSLSALNAFIAPPDGTRGFEGAVFSNPGGVSDMMIPKHFRGSSGFSNRSRSRNGWGGWRFGVWPLSCSIPDAAVGSKPLNP